MILLSSKEIIRPPTHFCRVDVNKKYYTWLCNLVGLEYNESDYSLLLKALHHKDFIWSVPNDDNRAFEGRELRSRFCDECNIVFRNDQYNELASMLELIIALAYRCESIMVDQNENIPMRDWFWKLISNSGLDKFTDEVYFDQYYGNSIDDILEKIIHRTYNRNGYGGLFPLKKHKKDQRRVELWYQMSSYLVENYYTEDVLM